MRHVACDVLVAGSGAAGLACAFASRDMGLNVIVVEKSDQIGGTTAWSGGEIWVP
jgi:succinate dehydrogenase/fumarate reductase flavoprotein subunit